MSSATLIPTGREYAAKSITLSSLLKYTLMIPAMMEILKRFVLMVCKGADQMANACQLATMETVLNQLTALLISIVIWENALILRKSVTIASTETNAGAKPHVSSRTLELYQVNAQNT